METPGFVSLRAQEGCTDEAEPGLAGCLDAEPDSTAPAFPAWMVPRVTGGPSQEVTLAPWGWYLPPDCRHTRLL